MELNEFFLQRRLELKQSQTKFYKGALSRKSADNFEKGDKSILKIKHLNVLTNKISCSIQDIIYYCPESFENMFDYYNNQFLAIANSFALDSMGEVPLSSAESEELLSNLESIYQVTFKFKDTQSNYLNLYLLIKIAYSSISNNILPVDDADLKDLKLFYKNKLTLSSYDYKILANLVVDLTIPFEKLNFLEKKLFPVEPKSSSAMFESSHLVLTNTISRYLREYNYPKVHEYLELLDINLKLSPSYRYRLLFLHNLSLLDFFESGYQNAEALSQAFQYINIIEACEPDTSTYANRLRESATSLLERLDNSKDVIAIIASAKSDIDFVKNLPPHLIKG